MSNLKNQTIGKRFLYAFSGILSSFRSESSFRAEIGCLACVILVLVITQPPPVWWALFLLTSGCVLAVELINTAIEKLVDHIHPDHHATIKIVKDTLAGAVLVMSVSSLAVFAAFLWGKLNP